MLNYCANGPSGYNLTNSLRFRSSASAYLSRTPASAGNQNTWTWSGWIKRGALGVAQDIISTSLTGTSNSLLAALYFDSSDRLTFFQYTSATVYTNLITTQVFRDPSAWYHIVVAYDDTQATAANRVKIYVNGNQITAFGTASYPTQNFGGFINQAYPHAIGRDNGSPNANYIDCYMTEINFVNAQALTPSSFGSTNSTTGVWQPKQYTGTYGTNGFYLKFSNIALTSGSNTGLGQDFSGNGNYWNTNNISVTAGTTYDAMTDVPTLTSATVANYCVLNPLVASTTATITNGNLNSTGSTTTFANARATFMLSSGKWYWEQTITGSSTLDIGIGLCTEASQKSSSTNIRQTGWYNVINGSPGDIGSSANGGANVTISTTNWATNDIIMVAYDADTGYIWFGRNGTWYPPTTGGTAGNPAAGTNQTISAVSNLIPASWHYNTNAGTAVNFGQRPFSYTPPTGFNRLNTFNLPTSTIVQGNKYMNATTYTGTGGFQSITNAGSMQPDLLWIKSRSNAVNNVLIDSVRGNSLYLVSNSTAAEVNNGGPYILFNSDGFSVGADSQSGANGYTYVAWQWKANAGTNTTNTAGSITSTVSVNASAGFSVVTYTGNGISTATVGHGLGVKPAMYILKERSSSATDGAWHVMHQSIAGQIQLQSTGAQDTGGGGTNGAPQYISQINSSTFGFQAGSSSVNNVNKSGGTYVAYCWASISGFSSFGSYTGNGSADGPFIYTGFLPRFVLIKNYSSGGSWVIHDTSRDTYNVTNKTLYPNYSNAESTPDAPFDVLSNGFKLRSATLNDSGAGFIYAAFASNPFKNSNAF